MKLRCAFHSLWAALNRIALSFLFSLRLCATIFTIQPFRCACMMRSEQAPSQSGSGPHCCQPRLGRARTNVALTIGVGLTPFRSFCVCAKTAPSRSQSLSNRSRIGSRQSASLRTHQLMLDPNDPWPEGYRIADTWPA